jgi:hypothetical protein
MNRGKRFLKRDSLHSKLAQEFIEIDFRLKAQSCPADAARTAARG